MHDCGMLVNRIEKHPPGAGLLEESDTGELATYLINGSTVCWVDPGVQAILDLFDEPRICSEVAELVSDALGTSEISLAVFEALVHAGLLVSSSISNRSPIRTPR